MHRFLRVCASALLSAALGCGGGAGNGTRDGALDGAETDAAIDVSTDVSSDVSTDVSTDANEVVCAGDQWAGDAEMLAAIAGCTTIAGNLSMTSNVLMGVDLPLLVRVDGFLTIWSNPMLTRVTLPALASIGGYLEVTWNDTLTNLAMPALKSVNERALVKPTDVVIRDNPLLPSCQAETLRDQLLAHGFDGSFSIANNGPCSR